MHISSVIKISFCRISFSGHQNKFCACLDSIYGSRVILVMCKNCSDISWHRLNLNQSKTNCPKNLNSDGLVVREMGPLPECIFRSLLQFLVYSTPPGRMDAISQTTLSNAFSWIKYFVFWFLFHWYLFPRVQEPTSSTNADTVHWHIYVARDGDEVNHQCFRKCPITSRCHAISKHTDDSEIVHVVFGVDYSKSVFADHIELFKFADIAALFELAMFEAAHYLVS